MLRENDGRGAVGMEGEVGYQSGGQAADFRKFHKADTATWFHNTVTAAGIILCVSLVLNIGPVAHAAATMERRNNPVLHKVRRTFTSTKAYLQSRGTAFTLQDANELMFYDRGGKLINKIPMGRDRDGFESRVLLKADFTPTTTVVKSTSGNEWARDILDFYSDSGTLLNSMRAPSVAHRASPDGKVIALAHKNTQLQYEYTEELSLFDSAGKLLNQFKAPFTPRMPTFIYSPDGAVGAALLFGRPDHVTRGGVVFFSAAGKVIGTFETAGWMPAMGPLGKYGRLPGGPIAHLDSSNATLVIAGFDEAINDRSIVAIDFDGHQRWRRGIPSRGCPYFIFPAAETNSMLVGDFCSGAILLTELDSKTGEVIRTRSIELREGHPSGVSFARMAKESSLLLTLVFDSQDHAQTVFLLLGSECRTLWKDMREGFSHAWIDRDESVVIRTGNQFQVGYFAK